MRSTQLDLTKYNSDKISNKYLERYDTIFESLVTKNLTLLELGVFQGGSLMLWQDYFPQGLIVGVDIALPKRFQPGGRVKLYEGSQADTVFLSRVAKEVAPEGFDIIIDDASHFGGLTKIAFWHLFNNHLKPHGIYAIEDWGTAYWDSWPDGKKLNLETYKKPYANIHPLLAKIAQKIGIRRALPSHQYGMVGFIKQLVDEQGAADVTKTRPEDQSGRMSKFHSMIITPRIVFIQKA